MTSYVAVAKYAYCKHNDDELSFPRGARFRVLEQHSSGWFVVEREDTSEKGLAPGNYFRITEARANKSPRGEEPRVAAAEEKKSPRGAEEKKSPRGAQVSKDDQKSPRAKQEAGGDDEAPPPLPGPPPPWSETIAGKEAARVASQLGGGGAAAAGVKPPRSPRSVVGMFDDEPSKDEAAARFGVALKKSGK
jgi:hypothetical protein